MSCSQSSSSFPTPTSFPTNDPEMTMSYSRSSSPFPALAHAKLIREVLVEKTNFYQRKAYFYLMPDSVNAFWVKLRTGEWMVSLKYPYRRVLSKWRTEFLPFYLGIVTTKPKEFIPPLIRKENPLYSYVFSLKIPYLPDSHAYILPNALPYREVLRGNRLHFDTTWAKQIHPGQFPFLYLVMYLDIDQSNQTDEYYYFFPIKILDIAQEGIYVENITRTPSEYQLQLRILPFPSRLSSYPLLAPASTQTTEFTIDVLNIAPLQVQNNTYIGFYPFPCNNNYSFIIEDAKWVFHYSSKEIDQKFYLNLLLEDGFLDSFCLGLRLDTYTAQQPRDTISLLNPFSGDKSPLQSSYQSNYTLDAFLHRWNLNFDRKTITILLCINHYKKEIKIPLEM